MSLQIAARSETPFKCAISLSGAVLDPEGLPECKHKETDIILQHNWDDLCFDWEERYIPMREAFKTKNYPVKVLERLYGGHDVSIKDVVVMSDVLAEKFGYANWQHPDVEDESVKSEFCNLGKELVIPDRTLMQRNYILERIKEKMRRERESNR